MGTGFPPPKMNGEPDAMSSPGKRTLMKGSRWRMGLRVTRPRRRADGSPRRSATHACAASCQLKDSSKMPITLTTSPGVSSLPSPVGALHRFQSLL